MKTQTKKSTGRAASAKTKRGPKAKDSPRKSIENTDLNTEDAYRTNASLDEDLNTKNTEPSNTPDNNSEQDTSVEAEQDREALRKMEDANPDEIMK